MNFLLAKYFFKSIFSQKLMFLSIVIITFFASLFVTGVVGYATSAKNSFNNLAQTVNLEQSLINSKRMKKKAGCSGSSCLYDITHDQKFIDKYGVGQDARIQSFHLGTGIQLEYTLPNNVKVQTKTSIEPYYEQLLTNIYKDPTKWEPRIYGKPYILNNKKVEILTAHEPDEGKCYIASIWAKKNHINIGDEITIGDGDGAISLKVSGFANDLVQIGPVDGTDYALFGLPKVINNVFMQHDDFLKVYDNSSIKTGYGGINWVYSQTNSFKDMNSYKIASMDNFIYQNYFADQSIKKLQTLSGIRWFMTEYNNFSENCFISFFIWNSLINIYLFIGITLSVIFWLLSIIILFLTLKRIITINQARLATLKAIGYNAFELASGMLIYPIIISTCSISLGLGFGYFVQYYLENLYSNSYYFPTKLGFSALIYVLLIGLLFVGTNLCAFFYNYRKMNKNLMLLFNESKLKTPLLITACQPVLKHMRFGSKFTLLFGLKNFGKIIGSFCIMSASFSLLLFSVIALNTSVNFGLALNRGYSYDVQGSMNRSLKIICDNPHLTSGEKNFYLVNSENNDFSDLSSRLVPLTDKDHLIKVEQLKLKNQSKDILELQAKNIIDTLLALNKISTDYYNPFFGDGGGAKKYADGTHIDTTNIKNSKPLLIAINNSEISNLQTLHYIFADRNSGTKKDYQDFQKIINEQIKNNETMNDIQKQNLNESISLYLNKLTFNGLNSIGFGFKNISFTNETYSLEHTMTPLNVYDHSDREVKVKVSLTLDNLITTPNQGYIYGYNSKEFTDLLDQYPFPNGNKLIIPHDDNWWQPIQGLGYETIPIIINKTYGTYLNTIGPEKGPLKVGDYFQFKYSDSDKKLYEFRFKIIKIYDSYGPGLAWTSNKFLPLMQKMFSDMTRTNGDGGKYWIGQSILFYEVSQFYNNIGFTIDYGSYIYLEPNSTKWKGEITSLNSINNSSNAFYSLGFGHFINLVEAVFLIVAVLAILLSLFSIYIFFTMIINDDIVIFAAMNTLGYSWNFAANQIIKIYFTLMIIIIAIFLPLLNSGLIWFNAKFQVISPVDLQIYFGAPQYIVSVILMIVILFINFIVSLTIMKRQKAIKILAINQ